MSRGALVASLLLCACQKQTVATTDAAADAAPSPIAKVVPCEEAHVDTPPPVVPTFDAGVSAQRSPPLFIRQIKTVMVDDVQETWILRWRGKPEPSCVDERWVTCPCGGFAYGETGSLELARLRPEEPEEIFVFREHMEDEPELQHWIPGEKDDVTKGPTPTELKKKEVLDAMQLADYDHDGRVTEFLFRIGVGGSCGHTSTMRLVGLTKKKPKLHFIGDVSLRKDAWDQILKMQVPGSTTVITLPCGDHGSGEESSTVVSLDAQGNFRTKEKTRTCKPGE